MFGLSGGQMGSVTLCFAALVIFLRSCVADELTSRERRKQMIISGVFLIWMVSSQMGSLMGNRIGRDISNIVNTSLNIAIICFVLYYVGSAFVYVRKKQYDQELAEKAKEYQKRDEDFWKGLDELDDIQKPTGKSD